MLGLAIRDLEVRFPGLETPALAIASLDLIAGERVAVTGPSGSGKTTFINMLTGLDRARRGRVVWGDTDLARLPEGARDRWRAAHVGLVMQEFHLFPGLSAIENVVLPKRLARLGRGADVAGEAGHLLSRVGIGRPGQRVETMSRGQMQRVALARALLGSPGVVVADEPTASLDAEAGGRVADLLVELAAERGATLVVASHDARLIERLDRVVRLDAGRLAGP